MADVEPCCRYAPLNDVVALVIDGTPAAKAVTPDVLSAALPKSPRFEDTSKSNEIFKA
jgi:hypothetical protein